MTEKIFTKRFNGKIPLTTQEMNTTVKVIKDEWNKTKINNDKELKLELSRVDIKGSRMTIKELAIEMRAGFAQVRQDLSADIAQVREDLSQELNDKFNNLYEKNPSLNK